MPARSKTAGPVVFTGPPSYWEAARRPLAILAFLLPLVLAYELGLALVLRSGRGVLTNKAHETLLRFFELFGLTASSGLFLGGAVILAVLLSWHLLARQPWQLDPMTPLLMAVESAALTVPLLALGLALRRGEVAHAAVAPDMAHMTLGARLAISIGAGLYEELLFRMMLIAVLHTLLVDVAKMAPAAGAAIAVVVSAAAFTWYHPLRDQAGAVSPQRVVFFLLAGLYFGGIYLLRGFGIVVGTHALYDVVVVSIPG